MARILIMEDDPLQAEVWAAALTARGHEVSHVAGAGAALETLARRPFDLLVTDLHVRSRKGPGPDGGLYLIGRMRASGASPSGRSDLAHMPIVAVSGASRTGSRAFDPLATARALGADAGLRKPASPALLVETVERFA
jgi:CheY-like chemotaxis protein